MQLLRDAPALGRGGAVHQVRRRGLREHAGEVLAQRRREIGIAGFVRQRRSAEHQDTQDHAGVRAADRGEEEVRRGRGGPVRPVLAHAVAGHRRAPLAQDLRQDHVGPRRRDLRGNDLAVADRSAQAQAVLLRRPHADRVMTQVVGDHRDRAFEIAGDLGAERREAGQLVEGERLAAVDLGAVELIGREQRGGDVGRDLGERLQVRGAVALLLPAVLHAHHAERAPAGLQRRDHRLAGGRVGAARDRAGQQHRLAGRRDLSRDPLADPLAVLFRRLAEPARAADGELSLSVGEHDRDAVGAEGIDQLRRRAVQQLIGLMLAANDCLDVARRLEPRLRLLLLTLRAPERVRLGELESHQLAHAGEPRDLFRTEHVAHAHRG